MKATGLAAMMNGVGAMATTPFSYLRFSPGQLSPGAGLPLLAALVSTGILGAIGILSGGIFAGGVFAGEGLGAILVLVILVLVLVDDRGRPA